jgi:hypothetical protein
MPCSRSVGELCRVITDWIRRTVDWFGDIVRITLASVLGHIPVDGFLREARNHCRSKLAGTDLGVAFH